MTIQYKKALQSPPLQSSYEDWQPTSPLKKFELSTDFHSTAEVQKMGILKLTEEDNG